MILVCHDFHGPDSSHWLCHIRVKYYRVPPPSLSSLWLNDGASQSLPALSLSPQELLHSTHQDDMCQPPLSFFLNSPLYAWRQTLSLHLSCSFSLIMAGSSSLGQITNLSRPNVFIWDTGIMQISWGCYED